MSNSVSAAEKLDTDLLGLKTRTRMAWFDGGSVVSKSTSAPSLSLNVRLGYVGFGFGFGGSYDLHAGNVADYCGMAPGYFSGRAGLTPLGKKHLNPAFGFDILFFWDITEKIGLYAGPGMYFQEIATVYKSNDTGRLYNFDYRKHELSVQYGGGLLFKLWDFEKTSLLFTTGYHSQRGVTAGTGFSF